MMIQYVPRLLGSDGDKGLLHALQPHQDILVLSVFQTFFRIHPDLVGSSEIVVALCTLEV